MVRRLPFGAIAAILLVGLVGLLGTLQYRWLGQVSQAEREQLRRSLEQRAREFADDFDGEISRVYQAVQARGQVLDAAEWPAFAVAVDRWRAGARFPQVVRAIYLADASGDRRTLRPYDAAARTFGPSTDEWPAHLRSVRDNLTAPPTLPATAPANGARFVAMALMPIAPDAPALVVPVSRQVPAPGAGPGAMTRQWSGAYLLVDLDGDYLRRAVVPALVARHFPDRGADGYRVAILSAAGDTLLSRGFPADRAVDPARADLVMPFFGLRLDVVRELLPRGAGTLSQRAGAAGGGSATLARADDRVSVIVEHREAGGRGGSATGSTSGQIRVARPGWRLVLAHPSGSLDVAVSRARLRNLWLGFGILGVLAAGVVLVVLNGRRAGRLASQQMDFVATVSHELRTPLAVIRSAAQNLSAGVVADPERARRYGELIEGEGRRLTEMVEQVLEYARINGDRPTGAGRPVNLVDVAHDVARACEPLCAEAGVAIEVRAEPADVPAVAGDEAALRRALHNLVVNAVKHGADGRWVGVRVAPVAGKQPQVVVEVSDRGRGIEVNDLGHVFEPFYRGRRAVDEQVHGNGLGLSLVKRVVESHGGKVTARSVPGGGAVFTMHLPAAAERTL
jgi:signal transduction histidine kinase